MIKISEARTSRITRLPRNEPMCSYLIIDTCSCLIIDKYMDWSDKNVRYYGSACTGISDKIDQCFQKYSTVCSSI